MFPNIICKRLILERRIYAKNIKRCCFCFITFIKKEDDYTMKKKSLFLSTLILAIILLFACSAPGGNDSQGSSESQSTDNGQNGSVNATSSLTLGGIEYSYTEAVISEFEEKYPDIEVTWNPGNTNFEDGSIQAVLQSGEGPDAMVVNSGPSRVGRIAEAGLIKSLEEIPEVAQLLERYNPSIVEQTRASGNGEVYELIEGIDVFQVYYNENIFAEHGLSVPTTWEEFLSISEELKNAGIPPLIGGFRDNFQGGWLFGNIVQSSTGKEAMTEAIYGEGRVDGPDFVRAAQMLKELVDNGYLDGEEALALDGEQAEAAFLNEQGAMMVAGQGIITSGEADGMDVSMFKSFIFPSINGEDTIPTAGLAHSWIVSANTDNEEAVQKWLDWVSSKEYLEVTSENGAGLVPVLEAAKEIDIAPSIEDAINKYESGAGYNPSVYLPAKAKTAWYSAVQEIVSGSTTPEEAMKHMQSELELDRQE